MNVQKLLYLICLVNLLFACQNSVDETKNYADYHTQIIKAEQFIAEEKYENAFKMYEEIINEYDFVFLRDYKIAIQLALYTNKKDEAFIYIEKGIRNGLTLDELKENKFITKHLNDSEWKNIANEYGSLHRQYLKRINTEIRTKVESMFNNDQKIAYEAAQIEDEVAQEKFIIDAFPAHSEKQLENLINILDKYGYPGELLIGNDFWMSTIISHHNSISQEYVKKDTLYNFIKPKLAKALSKGEISPYEFVMMEDWRKAVISDRKEAGYGFLNSPNESNLSEVNKNREKIGLRSIELRNRLVDIERKTNMNFYLPDWIEGKISIEKTNHHEN